MPESGHHQRYDSREQHRQERADPDEPAAAAQYRSTEQQRVQLSVYQSGRLGPVPGADQSLGAEREDRLRHQRQLETDGIVHLPEGDGLRSEEHTSELQSL